MIQNPRHYIDVLAVDPGKTVGWSWGMGYKVLDSGQDSRRDFLDRIYHWPTWRVRRVVAERFDIRQITNDAMETVEFIGALKFLCQRKTWKYIPVNAVDKKKFIDLAKEMMPGQPHAIDAEALRRYDLEYGEWV